jgi:hypothetical protein
MCPVFHGDRSLAPKRYWFLRWQANPAKCCIPAFRNAKNAKSKDVAVMASASE